VRILLVEDDPLVADAVRRALCDTGFTVDHVVSAEDAQAALRLDDFDLAVVDIGLPHADGLQLVQGCRRSGQNLPILMLTARDGLRDRVAALDLGADDYLVKPFQVPELLSRCRALIRRSNAVASSHLTIGELDMDLSCRMATIAGMPLNLTHREWSILESLALKAGRIVPKEKLLSTIASFDDAITPNAVEVYVSRLRSKLGAAASIRSVRGLGYRLDEPGN